MPDIFLRADQGNTQPRSANVVVKNEGLSNIELDNNFNNINNAIEYNQYILLNSYEQANSGVVQAQAAFASANNVAPQIEPAFNQANTGVVQAQAAFGIANNAASNILQLFEINNTQNNSIINVQGVNETQNLNILSAQSTAESSFQRANSAFDSSNTKFSSSGGIIDGSVEITGDLTITGNNISHSANNFIINDPIVLLANNNPGNLLDLGYVAHYKLNGDTLHTGLIRHSVSNTYYLFDNYLPHIQESNILDINDASFRTSDFVANNITAGSFSGLGSNLTNLNASYLSSGTVPIERLVNIPNNSLANSSLSINGVNISLGGSGTVTASAETLSGTSLNSAVVNSSLTSVGTLSSLNVSSGGINTYGSYKINGETVLDYNTISNIENVNLTQNTIIFAAFGQANTGAIQAQAAFAAANNEPIAKSAFGQANLAFAQANTGVTQAQAAFAAANNEPIAKSAFGQANLAFAQANTSNTNAANASFLTEGTIPNARLSNIPNSSLSNSSITINGTNISLGSSGTVTAAAGTLTGSTLASGVTGSSLTSVGTITSGTWSGSFGAVSGANLTSLTAGNLSGTIPSGVLGNSTHFVGTTSIALNRSSASQILTGVSIDGSAGSVGNTVTFTNTGGAAAGTTYNGSAARTIDFSTLGAAASSHTHNYAGSASAGGAATSVASAVTFNNGGAGSASGTTFNGSSAVTISYNTVGAPSTTGTNASGSWGISVTGNAATAGGFTPSQTNGVGSRIVVADASGYINNNYFNSTDDVSTGTISHIMAKFGDNYFRSATAAKVAAFISGQSMNISGSSTSTTGNAATVTNGLYTTGGQTIAGRNVITGSQTGSLLTATGSVGGIELQSSGSGTAAFMSFHRPGAYASYFGIDTDNNFAVGGWSAGAALGRMKVGSFGVGTASSGTAGEIRATNNITAYYSDKRLKNILGTIPNALEKINSISGVYFTQNEKAEEFGYTNRDQQVGVIAQEIQQVLPEAIKPAPFDIENDDDGNEYSKSGENYLTVQYEKLVPLLIEGIKEQQKIIDSLKFDVEQLKDKLKTIE